MKLWHNADRYFSMVFTSAFRPEEVSVSAIFFHRQGVPYVVGKESHYILKHHGVTYPVALHHIFQYDGAVDASEIIICQLLVVFKCHRIREGRECDVIGVFPFQIVHVSSRGDVFFERKRQNLNLHITSG